MATNNPNNSINHIPFLSEEMEWTLRRLAWRDEIFREALIADPKGIIHYLFHQSLPNGKLPNDLTIKVIEQDPYTRHIVLPAFADEEPTLEIPEEEQVEFIANLGSLDRKRPRDSSQQPKEADSEKKKTFGDTQFELRKDQAKQTEKQIKETKVPTEKEIAKALLVALKQDKDIIQAMKQALNTDSILKSDTLQMMQEKGYLSSFNLPKDVTYQLHLNDKGTYHILLSSSRDESRASELDHNAIANVTDKNKVTASVNPCIPVFSGNTGVCCDN